MQFVEFAEKRQVGCMCQMTYWQYFIKVVKDFYVSIFASIVDVLIFLMPSANVSVAKNSSIAMSLVHLFAVSCIAYRLLQQFLGT